MDAVQFQTEVLQIEKLLFRIAWSYLGNPSDVEDAVQEALLRAWEKRESLRDPGQFRPWMTRILSNHCKDVLRRRKKFRFLPIEDANLSAEMPEVEVPVLAAMRRLKPEQQLVMTLRYVDGLSIQEIAAALGLTEGAVKSRLHHARKQLSKTLLVEWEVEV